MEILDPEDFAQLMEPSEHQNIMEVLTSESEAFRKIRGNHYDLETKNLHLKAKLAICAYEKNILENRLKAKSLRIEELEGKTEKA